MPEIFLLTRPVFISGSGRGQISERENRNVSQDGEQNEDGHCQLNPTRSKKKGREWLAGGLVQKQAQAHEYQERESENGEWIKVQCGQQMAMGKTVHGAQPPAARTIN